MFKNYNCAIYKEFCIHLVQKFVENSSYNNFFAELDFMYYAVIILQHFTRLFKSNYFIKQYLHNTMFKKLNEISKQIFQFFYTKYL